MPWISGVVFLDDLDRKMVLLRSASGPSNKVIKLGQCGLPKDKLFSFYDQVHTTGMDIKQHYTARAALTLGKDMTFRDFAQGAYRMRGIGQGQTLTLFIITEVAKLIQLEVASGAGGESVTDVELYFDFPAEAYLKTSILAGVVADSRPFPAASAERTLQDVTAWLILNGMKSERTQFNMLCGQNVGNVWRKLAFRRLLADHGRVGTASGVGDKVLMQCIQVFREQVSGADRKWC